MQWLERKKWAMRDWMVRHAHGPYATPALFLFSFAEAIFWPLPVELVLAPLAAVRRRRWYYFAWIATAASVLGALAGYLIGLLFFEVLGEPLVLLYGLEDEFVRTSALLAEGAFVATFVSAFTPIPWKVFTLAAGLLHAPLFAFFVAALLGRGIRFFVFSYVVKRWGKAVARLVLRYFTYATIAAVVLVLLFVWWRFF